jgi:hypothetical protein
VLAAAVRRPCADEGLEALSRLILGGEIAGFCERLGALLGGKQALQLQRLLHAQAGQLIAGLRHLQGAGGISGAGHGIAEQADVAVDSVGDLALQQGGTPERGVFLVPSALGVAQHVVGRQRCRDLAREQAVVAALRGLQPQCDAITSAKLGLDVAERALQIGTDGRPQPLQVLVHTQDHLRLVLQLAHLVVDLLQRPGRGE